MGAYFIGGLFTGAGEVEDIAHILQEGSAEVNASSRIIEETLSGAGDITSQHTLTSDELLQAGEEFLGPGYKELGKPGSGVFRSADETRQLRIDNGSITGSHDPYVPHGHMELFSPGASKPYTNNHIPFTD